MSHTGRISRSQAIAYALPSAGLMWTQLLFTHYIFKYAVDVLGIAAATIGWILLVTRTWDAISDPLVAYLTDRSTSRAGRRRPWLLGSVVPVALTTYFMWNPARGLDPQALYLWMFAVIALWETAMTTYFIPYMALGSEISMEHHDRTRVAGYRHVFGGIGQLCVIASIWALTEAGGTDAQRDVAAWLVGFGVVAASLFMGGTSLVLREPEEHRERGARRPLGAVRGVLSNRHLAGLVGVYFFEITSVAANGLVAAFVCQYVIGQADLFPILLLAYQLASYASTPLLVKLSRQLGKRRTWMAAMALQASGFTATLGAGHGDAIWLIACLAIAGLSAAGGQVLGLSILADAVDFDEWRSGERREALHYAAINIARKLSFASLSALVGVAMQQIGYVPRAVQSAETVRGLAWLYAGIPAVALLIAMALLGALRLGEGEHARIRAELDARR
jgi:sugar (glycoside-pentoside-hexuronide) transporter